MLLQRGSEFDKVQYDTSGHYGSVSSKYFRELDLEYYATVNLSVFM